MVGSDWGLDSFKPGQIKYSRHKNKTRGLPTAGSRKPRPESPQPIDLKEVLKKAPLPVAAFHLPGHSKPLNAFLYAPNT
jgi:hypothetical protein